MAGLIRVTALAASRRRAGFAFSREPLVIGPESLGEGLDALRAIAAIVGDPVLVVERSDEDTPDVFIAPSLGEREAILDMARAAELANGDEDAKQAIAQIVAGLIGERTPDPELAGVGLMTSGGDIASQLAGEREFERPDGPEINGDGAAAPASATEGKADGGTIAAPAVETPPASDASTASGEQSRAGADASGAAPAAGADAGKQPEDTQQPPVVDGTTRPDPAGDAANPAVAAPAAPAEAEPKKGDAVPAKPEKAKAVAKPQSSSGRQSKPAISPAAKG